jgi:hypothetical protein
MREVDYSCPFCNSCGLKYSRQVKSGRKSFGHSGIVQYGSMRVNVGAITATSASSPPGGFFGVLSLQHESQDPASTSMTNTVSQSDSDQDMPDSLPSAITGVVPLISLASPDSCDTGVFEIQEYEATYQSTAGLEGYESVNSIPHPDAWNYQQL